MHDKYGKQGLAILTVALDAPAEKDLIAEANKEIARHPKLTRNVVWDGPEGEWQTKLNAISMPVVFVFNAENRWVKRLPEKHANGDEKTFEYSDLDNLVEPLLKKK